MCSYVGTRKLSNQDHMNRTNLYTISINNGGNPAGIICHFGHKVASLIIRQERKSLIKHICTTCCMCSTI